MPPIKPFQTKSGGLCLYEVWIIWAFHGGEIDHNNVHYNVARWFTAHANTFNITSTRMLCLYNAIASWSAGFHASSVNCMLAAAELNLHWQYWWRVSLPRKVQGWSLRCCNISRIVIFIVHTSSYLCLTMHWALAYACVWQCACHYS